VRKLASDPHGHGRDRAEDLHLFDADLVAGPLIDEIVVQVIPAHHAGSGLQVQGFWRYASRIRKTGGATDDDIGHLTSIRGIGLLQYAIFKEIVPGDKLL